VSDRGGFSLARVLELVAAVDAAMPVGLPIEVAVGGAVAMMQIAPGRLSEDRPPTQSSWPAPSPAARC